MKNTSKYFTQIFHRATANNKSYHLALEIVKHNSEGKVWLIGGFIFRNIVSYLYGTSFRNTDFDFLVEKPKSNITLSPGWEIHTNGFGNKRLICSNLSIDFIPLNNLDYVNKNHLKPSIKNYLKGVPLTIQSIAYDYQNETIIGKVGKQAILDKTVAINNLEQALSYFIPPKDLITEKATSLGFTPIFPI